MKTNQAEDVNDSTSDANVDQADAIADLLVGGDEQNEDENEQANANDDSKEVGKQADESTGDAGADQKNAEVDDDTTWESVLGVGEGKVNIDEDGNLAGINVKIEGKTSTISMDDLITGYQYNKANTQKSQALAEERKVFTEQKGQVEQAYESKLSDVIALHSYLEKRVVSEFDNVDWDKLRYENPAEYAALKQDYSARAQELQNIKNHTQKVKNEQMTEQQNEHAANNQKFIKDQFDTMILNNPDWNNKETYSTDMNQMKAFCSEQYGFTQEDFSQVHDARMIEVIKDAQKYRKGMQLGKKKMNKPVPTFQKSTGQSHKRLSKLDRLTKAARSASGSNKRILQTNAVAELLTGG